MIGFGTFFGGLFGYLLGKALGISVIGLIFGGWMGYRFDRALRQILQDIPFAFSAQGAGRSYQRSSSQQIFFEGTFAVMGHLAKADGVVSAQEIEIAESAMQQCRMNAAQRREARAAFNRGKSSNFNLEQELHKLKNNIGNNFILMRLFLDFQIQTAQADGTISPPKQQRLEKICRLLGIQMQSGGGGFQQNFGFDQGFGSFGGGGARQNWGQQASLSKVKEAYQTLGVNENDSDQVIKKKYHKLMGEHHPDRLMAKGLPEEMMKMATQKAGEIQAAYDLIRKSRGTK